LRADCQLGPKESLPAILYCRDGLQAVARHYRDVLEKLANINLDIRANSPKLEGAFRSTPSSICGSKTTRAFDEAQRSRLEKEIQHLKKLVADKDRQLGNESSSVERRLKVKSLRDKRAEYQAQFG